MLFSDGDLRQCGEPTEGNHDKWKEGDILRMKFEAGEDEGYQGSIGKLRWWRNGNECKAVKSISVGQGLCPCVGGSSGVVVESLTVAEGKDEEALWLEPGEGFIDAGKSCSLAIGNRTATFSANSLARMATEMSSGRHELMLKVSHCGMRFMGAGVCPAGFNLSGLPSDPAQKGKGAYTLMSNGMYSANGKNTKGHHSEWDTNDFVKLIFDADSKELQCWRNGEKETTVEDIAFEGGVCFCICGTKNSMVRILSIDPADVVVEEVIDIPGAIVRDLFSDSMS